MEEFCEDGFNVLEAGCGSGLVSLELTLIRDIKCVLLDIRGDMIQKAKRNFEKYDDKNVDFIRADVQNLPFIDESFDLVFNEGVIEHLDNIEGGVKEMARVSRKYCFIFHPNYYNLLWRIEKKLKRRLGKFYHGADEYGTEKDLTHKMTERWLKECGFSTELLGLGGIRRDEILPKTLKTSIGILGIKKQ